MWAIAIGVQQFYQKRVAWLGDAPPPVQIPNPKLTWPLLGPQCTPKLGLCRRGWASTLSPLHSTFWYYKIVHGPRASTSFQPSFCLCRPYGSHCLHGTWRVIFPPLFPLFKHPSYSILHTSSNFTNKKKNLFLFSQSLNS